MQRYHASLSQMIPASAAALYAIVADYRTGHPFIIPKKYFQHLEVEQGGFGAGTIITFQMTVAGTKKQFRHEVREPESGHVLQEVDLTSDLVTTFTFTPSDVHHTQVSIETTASTQRAGLLGKIEAWLTQTYLRRIYALELAQLAQVVRERAAADTGKQVALSA